MLGLFGLLSNRLNQCHLPMKGAKENVVASSFTSVASLIVQAHFVKIFDVLVLPLDNISIVTQP
jgi:hypothetical protein